MLTNAESNSQSFQRCQVLLPWCCFPFFTLFHWSTASTGPTHHHTSEGSNAAAFFHDMHRVIVKTRLLLYWSKYNHMCSHFSCVKLNNLRLFLCTEKVDSFLVLLVSRKEHQGLQIFRCSKLVKRARVNQPGVLVWIIYCIVFCPVQSSPASMLYVQRV